MAQAGELLFKPTMEAMDACKLNSHNSVVEILPTNLPPEKVSILGACGLILNLDEPRGKYKDIILPDRKSKEYGKDFS